MRTTAPGMVIGSAGASVAGVDRFGELGKVGAGGEVKSGALLAQLAARPGGPTVVHDVRIPIEGFTANIDHVVVSGRHITLLDTKVWRDGIYWTFGGKTRRGLEPVPHLDRKTLSTGVESIGRMLYRFGVDATFRRSVLIVWPTRNSSDGPSLRLYRPAGAVPLVVRDEQRALRRLARLTGTKPADQQVVSALTRILYT